MADIPGAGVTPAELQALESSVLNAFPSFMAQLEQLCNIDCGSYSPAGVNEVATWVAAFFGGIGAQVERRPDPEGRLGDTVVATVEGARGAGPRRCPGVRPGARARRPRPGLERLTGHSATAPGTAG